MYLTFSIEPSYGSDATSQDYVVDLISDEIMDNVNYVKTTEFNHPTSRTRYKSIKTVGGTVDLEFTFGNEAWNILFQSLIGQRLRVSNFALARSYEKWNIITGMLAADITASATIFNITEYKIGEFDNIAGIIVDSEYIAISAISNGSVTGSTRASEGSTAALHTQSTLVYGVEISGGKSIDIISRYRNGYCYSLPTSLTMLMYRAGDYFKFNGIKFFDFIFNSRPQEGVSAAFNLRGRNSGIIELASPSATTDDYQMLDTDNINCYSMNSEIDISSLYFQISNTLTQTTSLFMDSTYQAVIVNAFSAYGQFSIPESSIDYYNSYINDETKNLSMTICNSRPFTKAYVFAFNNIKWGTMQHILRSNIIIQDSIPFYVFGDNNFTILIQN